jgi:hypothetical protein
MQHHSVPRRGFDSLRSDARDPFRPIKESNKKLAPKFEAGFLVPGTRWHSQSWLYDFCYSG